MRFRFAAFLCALLIAPALAQDIVAKKK